MNLRILLFCICIALKFNAFAQKVAVWEQIPSEGIKATASSAFNEFQPQEAVNGNGMKGPFHQSHNLGRSMWISEVSTRPVRANASTRQGVVWYMVQFDQLEKGVDCVKIWNQNQNQHTRRGLQKVYIEYSADGRHWTLLKNGTKDYYIIPEAHGRKEEPESLSILCGGVDMKYFCITADVQAGNYYHVGDPSVMEDARRMSQNVNYYGLSEVRFYRSRKVAVSQLKPIKTAQMVPSQGYLKSPEGPTREFTLRLDAPLFTGGMLQVKVNTKTQQLRIPSSKEGIYSIEGHFPAGYMEEQTEATLSLTTAQGKIEEQVVVPAARKWELYFLPHSHLDIGYTHKQQDVMHLQWDNLERAIELASRTQDYPQASRFKWNSEATWCVMGYLQKYQGTPKAARLIEAIQKGAIGIDASLGSILTGVSKQEELSHIFDDAQTIESLTGKKINTAMMSDLPGQVWGYVTAMTQNNVRYLSSGPNYVPMLGRLGSYGVGLYNLKWGDLPFWWSSQSGNEKVLYWQTGKGYSMFHGWLMDRLSVCGTEPVWNYLSELQDKRFPYDLTYLRYTIFGDNGPPDELLPEVIRQWNEKYEYPRFVIGTTQELFTRMEQKYGDVLPTYQGDMTPVWEDGAASTAHELAVNRESAERLNQAEILWSMLRSCSEFPSDRFLKGWKNVVLFSEHTWGASASGPEPESDFTKELWAGKKIFADSADYYSHQLYDEALRPVSMIDAKTKNRYVYVINTQLWSRSDVIVFESSEDLSAKALLSSSGERVPLQRLSGNRWAFYAHQIPALSRIGYQIVPGKATMTDKALIVGNQLDNGRIHLAIDSKTGAIDSFKRRGDDYEYAMNEGLNDYLYSGRDGKEARRVEAIQRMTVLEEGPVMATLRIESEAPGCKSLTREITIYRNIDRIDIVNRLDKLKEYQHENVRFAFPFNIENPEVRMDLAMSEMVPEKDQLEGANKNFYSILNGLSVADIKRGIYLTSIDAPFVEMGSMSADEFRLKKEAMGWLNAATTSSVIYSWAMNNRWRTNYKASQEGIATFRYSMELFDPIFPQLKRQGAEQAQKLVAAVSSEQHPSFSLFRVKGSDQVGVSTIRPTQDQKGLIVKLQNMNSLTLHASLEWIDLKVGKVTLSNNREEEFGAFDPSDFWMKPFDQIIIKVELLP